MFVLRLLVSLLLLPFRIAWAVLRLVVFLPFVGRPPAYVRIHLKGMLRWREVHQRRLLRRRRRLATIADLERLLDEVVRDRKIRGVLVQVGDLHASEAQWDALGAAFGRVRAAGKEVAVWYKQLGREGFALFPAATRILVSPGAPIELVGISAAVSTLRELLDHLGIVPEFFRRGRWKTAPERLTRRDLSPEQRTMIDEVLDRKWNRLLHQVASRRGGDRAWAEGVVDAGPYTGRSAQSAGLVDAEAYPDELVECALPERDGTPRGRVGAPPMLWRSRPWRMRPTRFLAPPVIAIVPITGMIKSGRSVRWGSAISSGDESVVEALEIARKSRAIRAVVVQIESRGGAAMPSQLMWRAVRRCAKEKPTVAYVEGVAASGGYFAAAGARRIVAAPGALVGSIGVFAGRFDTRALFGRLGIHREVFLRGAHAGLLEPAHSLSDGERAVLQRQVDEIYREFVACVAESRGVPPAEIDAVGEGRVFVAAGAPDVLVDQRGGFPDALAWVAREAGIDPEEARLVRLERAKGRAELHEFFGRLRGTGIFPGPMLLWPELIEVR